MNQVIRLSEIMAKAEFDPESENASNCDAPPEPDTELLRMAEAILFAAAAPIDEKALSTSLPRGADVPALISELRQIYENRGVNLVSVAGIWQFRTAPDLGFLLRREQPE